MLTRSVFDQPPPAFATPEVAAMLQQAYGISGAMRALASERDQNLLVDAGDRQYVLKIANAAEDRAHLALQNAALDHLARVDPGLGVPRVVAALDGAAVVDWQSAAATHAVRLLSYLPGEPWSAAPRGAATLASLGDFLGRLSRALRGFGHPAAHRPGFLWNLDGVEQVRPWVADLATAEHRALAERRFARHAAHVIPARPGLRAAVLHQDANDHNLVVDDAGQVTGVIDFGDMAFGCQINELAIALAYALLATDDLYATARPIIAGYAARLPVEPAEADLLFELVGMRLVGSVCISSHRGRAYPDHAYLRISQAPALALLERLDRTPARLLAAFARDAAGLPPVADHDAIVGWLGSPACAPSSVFGVALERAPRLVLALAATAATPADRDDGPCWGWIDAARAAAGAQLAIAGYGEDRAVYTGDQFRTAASPERRTRHLGVDLFVAAGTPLHAPLPGRVLSVADNAGPKDYGPTVILEHEAGPGGARFWTLYGHLARETLARVSAGQAIAAGERLGSIGDPSVNGGWAPHLHVQLITDRLDLTGDFPGACQPSLWSVWRRISPDPELILRLGPESYAVDPTPPEVLRARRAAVLGPSLSLGYRRPLKLVRGRGAYLYDHTGRAYLDGVNNICHLGHGHPRVVAALARQAGALNTNTRYLHDALVAYAERLAATFPDPLAVVYMVCSGSEANELALRIARSVTGRHHAITLDWAYHGNTSAALDVSPYKFNRPGGRGKPAHVEIATLPDPYRGEHPGYGRDAGLGYARSVADKLDVIRAATGHGPAAFIAEAISGCGGQVVYPSGYLAEAARLVRAAGGLVIIDEVQTGFGRVGSHLWAHELQGVVPDIVTLGKPIGNGHPMAAVVTTRAIADAFCNGMEFFSSFGGNPVSAAVGMAVLDVLEDEPLQARAHTTGRYLTQRLRELSSRWPAIGDVRGCGLFLGVDLVSDRATRAPATRLASDVVNRMCELGVLVSSDGPGDNVLKIKPPLVFGPPEADLLVDALDRALGEAVATGA
jgi:4-aminobutyrate aminotransferase-like enzyme/Ser/Thr protein kinase RdoA (MazF antagonist)/murein DD-endopeptidase MepM/ murein hydrolase activator NlpD